jgi:hypothetical protein
MNVRSKYRSVGITVACLFLAGVTTQRLQAEEQLGGVPQSDASFCSSWIDFEPMSLPAGKKIFITTDRSGPNPTSRILVRIHRHGSGYSSDAISIADRKITQIVETFELPKTYPDIDQISIHGGMNPFGNHPMPSNQGRACPIMTSVELR